MNSTKSYDVDINIFVNVDTINVKIICGWI